MFEFLHKMRDFIKFAIVRQVRWWLKIKECVNFLLWNLVGIA